MMPIDAQTISIAKYIVAAGLFVCVALAPAYLATKNGKGKYDVMRIRAASWLFGWTGIGWLVALFWAMRK